jgi:hypothetical protein
MRMHQPLHLQRKVITDDNVTDKSFLPPLDAGSSRSSFSAISSVRVLPFTCNKLSVWLMLMWGSVCRCAERKRRGGLESAAQTRARNRRAATHPGTVGCGETALAGPQRGQREPLREAAIHRAEPPEPAGRAGVDGLFGGVGSLRVPTAAAGATGLHSTQHRCRRWTGYWTKSAHGQRRGSTSSG